MIDRISRIKFEFIELIIMTGELAIRHSDMFIKDYSEEKEFIFAPPSTGELEVSNVQNICIG